MKNFLLTLIMISFCACENKDSITKNAFIGTWHLESINDSTVNKGVIMYSPDGQMSAILSKNDSMVIGYSGKYEINTKESFVTHFRDFYSILPYPRPTVVPIYVRDFSFSKDFKTLTLRPKEDKGLTLIWKKVSN